MAPDGANMLAIRRSSCAVCNIGGLRHVLGQQRVWMAISATDQSAKTHFRAALHARGNTLETAENKTRLITTSLPRPAQNKTSPRHLRRGLDSTVSSFCFSLLRPHQLRAGAAADWRVVEADVAAAAAFAARLQAFAALRRPITGVGYALSNPPYCQWD